MHLDSQSHVLQRNVQNIASIMVLLGMVCACCAQVGTATFTWELSVDGGTTWNSGLTTVSAHQREVQGRVRVAWSPDAGAVLGTVRFDGVIHGLAGVGGADVVTRTGFGDMFSQNWYPLQAMRMGNLIKFDDPQDTLAPGAGPLWCRPSQSYWFGNGMNPINVLDFTLRLDGSRGTREFSSIFGPIPQYEGRGSLLVHRVIPISPFVEPNFPQTTLVPAMLEVVPSPGVLATLALVGAISFGRTRTGGRDRVR